MYGARLPLPLLLAGTRGRIQAMPPKRLQRQRSSSSGEGSVETGESEATSAMLPKPCFTCARQITPRAKWARNWAAIRFCSERCKGWRSIVKVGLADDLVATATPSLLERSLFARDAALMLHLDAWIEATLMHLVAAQGGSQRLAGVPLMLVSEAMHADLARQERSYHATIKSETLGQSPGEREMVRRAARRLVILPPDSWAFTAHFGPSIQRVNLTQNGGKRALRTLHDVSFAKGEMYAHAGESK